MRIEQIEETTETVVSQGSYEPLADVRLKQEIVTKSGKVFLSAFNSKNPADMEQLNTVLKREIAARDEKNKHLAQTFANHVEWFKKYVDNPKFIKLYEGERTLEAVAEATFWSVQLGLAPLLAKMSYAEIREFRPLEEWTFQTTERSALIGQVAKMMKKPANSYEASFALGQAAWASYIQANGYNVMKEEEARYESSRHEATSRPKSKL